MINNYLKLMNVTMKKWILFMFAFVGLAFAACSGDDVIDEGGGGEPGKESKADAWLSLRINPSTKTRVLNGTDQETGKPAESTVTSVKAILFKGFDDTSVVTNVVDLTGSNLLAADAFKVSSEAKSILLIVNPTSKLPNIAPGTYTFAEVNKAISASVEDVIGGSKDFFMMTNASGLLEPQTYSGGIATPGDIQGNTKEEKGLAESNRLDITVDRVVSKVRLYSNNSPTPPSAPIDDSKIVLLFTDLQWGLNVTNKKFYPISKRTRTFIETPDGGSTWSATPYGLGSYRLDPNYDDGTKGGINPIITPAQVESSTYTPDYIANYNFADAALSGNSFAINWKNQTTGTGFAAEGNLIEYCLENTQSKDFNQHAYTTHAMVRANVYPSHFKNEDGTYEDGVAGSDWMKIGDGYYTYTTLKTWMRAELIAYYKNSTATPITNTFNNYLRYLAGKSVAGIAGPVTIPSTTLETPEDQADLIITEFDGIIGAVSTHGGDTDKIINYYKGGVSYYKIMIKHDDTDTEMNELGEFGVVRNAVYDIKINSIITVGYPIIPKPDPETPDEESELWLAVDIKINNWTWYTQTEDL